MRTLVISLWLSLAHPHGTAQTPLQQLPLLTEFAKVREKWSRLMDLLWVWTPMSGIQKTFKPF